MIRNLLIISFFAENSTISAKNTIFTARNKANHKHKTIYRFMILTRVEHCTLGVMSDLFP